MPPPPPRRDMAATGMIVRLVRLDVGVRRSVPRRSTSGTGIVSDEFETFETVAQVVPSWLTGPAMGWNFRRRLNLGGGFRLNLSKRGIGASGGIRGFRIGLGPRGKRLQISVPGTGIYYRKDEGWQQQVRGSGVSVFRIAILLAAMAAAVVWVLGVSR